MSSLADLLYLISVTNLQYKYNIHACTSCGAHSRPFYAQKQTEFEETMELEHGPVIIRFLHWHFTTCTAPQNRNVQIPKLGGVHILPCQNISSSVSRLSSSAPQAVSAGPGDHAATPHGPGTTKTHQQPSVLSENACT